METVTKEKCRLAPTYVGFKDDSYVGEGSKAQRAMHDVVMGKCAEWWPVDKKRAAKRLFQKDFSDSRPNLKVCALL